MTPKDAHGKYPASAGDPRRLLSLAAELLRIVASPGVAASIIRN